MAKSTEVNMPLVNKFWLKAIQSCLYLLCHNHVADIFFLQQSNSWRLFNGAKMDYALSSIALYERETLKHVYL